MSRAERRRLEKEHRKSGAKTYNYTHEQIRSMIEKELANTKAQMVSHASLIVKETILAHTYYVLFNRFGFSEEDISKFFYEMNDLSDSICDGYLTNSDVFKFCQEELHISVDSDMLKEIEDSEQSLIKKGVIKVQ